MTARGGTALTARAEPAQLVHVLLETVAVALRDFPLNHLERLGVELDHASARKADQVIVVCAFERRLVVLPISLRDERGLNEAGLHEKWNGAVHRGEVRAGHTSFAEQMSELLDGEVSVVRQRGARDCFTHLRLLQVLGA